MVGMTLYGDVVGQDRALAQLRAAASAPVHSYLFTGPAGTGKRAAARSFAASLLCPTDGCGVCETCTRVLAGVHPDVVVVEREGAFIRVPQALEIARLASTSPGEARRKVLMLTDFHLVENAAPALLKTIEEPPKSSVFVILAEHVPPELVTIASRSARVEFVAVPADRIEAALVGDGVAPDVAAIAAAAAGGSVDRARLLASDSSFAARRALWQDAPSRLDGTGSSVAALAAELLASIEGVLEPLAARQGDELAVIDERAKLYGDRGSGRKDALERHKREQRRLRTDELRSGLATLAGALRATLAGTTSSPTVRAKLEGMDAIAAANEALIRNPNETLLLQALLVRLSAPTA